MKTETLLEDKREIESVTFVSDGSTYTVGQAASKIEVYAETGQMAMVPWIAIYIEGVLRIRNNATDCIIVYKAEER